MGAVLGFVPRASRLLGMGATHQPFFVLSFFKIRPLELFAWADFKLRSFWSVPPEELGLQA
jgi:hypothetical protein